MTSLRYKKLRVSLGRTDCPDILQCHLKYDRPIGCIKDTQADSFEKQRRSIPPVLFSTVTEDGSGVSNNCQGKSVYGGGQHGVKPSDVLGCPGIGHKCIPGPVNTLQTHLLGFVM